MVCPRDHRTQERIESRAKGAAMYRMLIVEDSQEEADRLAAHLKRYASEHDEELEIDRLVSAHSLVARSRQADLVFLDIVLPGMNGFAALRAIRRDPALRDIPVIMMSGNEQAMEQFFGTRIGADDFMKKPFSRYEIFFRIERLLDEHLVPRRAPAQAHPRLGDPANAV